MKLLQLLRNIYIYLLLLNMMHCYTVFTTIFIYVKMFLCLLQFLFTLKDYFVFYKISSREKIKEKRET